MTQDAAIVAEIAGLSVRRENGARVLDDANLQLRRGEVVCLVGPSGSGKTTAALALMGLIPEGLHPEKGHVVVDGDVLDPGRPEAYRKHRGKRIAIAFQDPLASLNPLRPCGKQVRDILLLHGIAQGKEAEARVLDHFTAMGLDDVERIYRSFPHQISGGQRQRVLIALATILQPIVLIADEPTASLDHVSRSQIAGLLRSLASERGTAVLLITHDIELAKSVGQRFVQAQAGILRELPADALSSHVALGPQKPESARKPVLDVRMLGKSFPSAIGTAHSAANVRVLGDVSLQVDAGEMLGVFGPSGAGKTTLGRCVAGLESPDAGVIILQGTPVRARGLRPHDGRVQMIYQSPGASLNPGVSVGRTIAEALSQAAIPESQHPPEVARLLAAVGLSESVAAKFPRSLSGGEKQRVAIARCLARRPQLIVADEPTASLDVANKHVVLQLLREVATAQGIAIVLITHERELAQAYCHRVLELIDARLKVLEAASQG